jgi:peptide/nickel transport system permease protein
VTAAGLVIRRLAAALGLLFVLASVVFWIDRAIFYDPGAYLLRDIKHPTNEQITRANELLGANGSLLSQYRDFVAGLLQGDLGVSWQTAQPDRVEGFVAEPVGPIVLSAVGVTGSLVLGGGVLLVLLAIPGGAWVAARAGSWADRTVLLVAMVAISTHPLVLGNLLQLVFGERLEWVPATGYCPFFGEVPADVIIGEPTGEPCGGPADWATHLVLPWVSFALLLVALHLRQMRAAAATVLAEPYIVAARAKGLSEPSLLRRHVLPNALPPVVTSIATDTGAALGVALYVESVFGMPGLGYRFLTAIQGTVGFDRPMIVAIVLVVGAAVIMANLVSDLLVAALDPRARSPRRGGRVIGSGA